MIVSSHSRSCGAEAAVTQDPRVAVDVGDLGLARRGVHVTRVEEAEAGAVAAGRDRPERGRGDVAAGLDRNLVLFLRAVVDDGQRARAAARAGALRRRRRRGRCRFGGRFIRGGGRDAK
eukprot:29814-Pelagococcus_subviridis.AAC.1